MIAGRKVSAGMSINNADQQQPREKSKLPKDEETRADFSRQQQETPDTSASAGKDNRQKWVEAEQSNVGATIKINLPSQASSAEGSEVSSVEKVMGLQGLEFPPLPFPVKIDMLADKEHWDKYTILGIMAEQGHRSLFLARDENVHRLVVMKVLRFSVNLEKYHMQRFLEEAQILAQLEHPAIVPVYEIGIDGDGQMYSTMRYLSGCPLSHFIHQKDMQNNIARNCWQLLLNFRQLCRALSYVHQQGVYHRNLIPDNVWVDHNRMPYLLGWSLCRVKDRGMAIFDNSANQDIRQSGKLQTIEGRQVGDLHYMAPEMITEKMRYVDERADIYSLGGILYYMMTGQHPFHHTNVGEVIQAICEGKRRLPHKTLFPVSSGLRHIIHKAMAIARTERYQSVDELIEDLDRLVLYKKWLPFL